ncbi:MAG: hypothetical protein J6O13_01500 [Selenomonas sp.]|nr:hypothetical protein [Anaerovibrio sp.]MBO6202182.1 hypothetical protein [Selenomonas sp.]
MLKIVHRAMFFRSEEDFTMRRAFTLRWAIDEDTEDAIFSIEPPDIDDDNVIVSTKYIHTADDDFSAMMRMMKLMIKPAVVVVDGCREG